MAYRKLSFCRLESAAINAIDELWDAATGYVAQHNLSPLSREAHFELEGISAILESSGLFSSAAPSASLRCMAAVITLSHRAPKSYASLLADNLLATHAISGTGGDGTDPSSPLGAETLHCLIERLDSPHPELSFNAMGQLEARAIGRCPDIFAVLYDRCLDGLFSEGGLPVLTVVPSNDTNDSQQAPEM